MRSRSVLATLALVALATLLGASPASAHSALVSSDPAAEGTVTAPLDRVTLTFTEAPLAGLDAGLRIEVRDARGADVSSGDVEVSGTTMSKAVGLGSGQYRVLWRYVSPDGHPITGEYGFTASLPTRTPSPTASSTAPVTPSAAASPGASAATATAAPAGATTHAGHSSGLVWVIGGLAVVVAVAAAVTAVLRRRGGQGQPRGAARVDDAGR